MAGNPRRRRSRGDIVKVVKGNLLCGGVITPSRGGFSGTVDVGTRLLILHFGGIPVTAKCAVVFWVWFHGGFSCVTLLVVVLSTGIYAPRKQLLRSVFTRVLCDFWENFCGNVSAVKLRV